MTHDELVEEINEAIADFDLKFDNSNPYYKALRAVVKLHRPEEITLLSGEVADTYCFECEGMTNYPCPTIQQIIENLK